ncbi:hypothetical protein F2Q68_00014651 [Brassica cretica]|uniref:Uncharacterized protein n=1 Tax=Brassica cretica TaxID=69181 RepID=A0A8S9H7X3_BRACR|nr:hypothetical protein F2Q68_00014651 [Brassica cretica]
MVTNYLHAEPQTHTYCACCLEQLYVDSGKEAEVEKVLICIEPVEPDFNNSSYACINRFFVNPKVFCSLPFRSSSLCSTAESADGDEVSRSSRRIAEQLYAHHVFDEIHETSFLGSQLCDRIHMIKRSLENLTAKARSSGANGHIL